jgi:hypothetical protein
MSLFEICQWIESTPSSMALRESIWVFPIIETTHVLGLAFSVGTIGWFDLRLVGVCMRRYRVSETFAYVRPWMLGGFVVMMIFASGADRYAPSTTFHTKMIALSVAIVVQSSVYVVAARDQGHDRLVTPVWMVLGGLAFVCWLAVGISGRFIAFY